MKEKIIWTIIIFLLLSSLCLWLDYIANPMIFLIGLVLSIVIVLLIYILGQNEKFWEWFDSFMDGDSYSEEEDDV